MILVGSRAPNKTILVKFIGIITNSIKYNNRYPPIITIIMIEIVPLILGKKIRRIKENTTKKGIKYTKSTMFIVFTVIDIIKVVKIAKKPQMIEIAKKFLTNSGSLSGPLARSNRGNVNAAFLLLAAFILSSSRRIMSFLSS